MKTPSLKIQTTLLILNLAVLPFNTHARPGDVDLSFDPGFGTDGAVQAVALQADGKVLIGGRFTNLNGTPRNGIARLNANGRLDTSFDPGTGVNGDIRSVVVQPDGKIVIGGSFTTFNETLRFLVARLNANGSLDTNFNLERRSLFVVVMPSIRSVAVQTDGKALIGGEYFSYFYRNIPRNSFARVNTDGSLDLSTFDQGIGADGTVYSVAVQSDGKGLIGGQFSAVNRTNRNGIARLNIDGSLDSSFNPDIRTDGAVYSVGVQSNDKVIIGGFSYYFDGTGRDVFSARLHRLNPDGSVDRSFNPIITGEIVVYSIAVQPDGKVLAGGFSREFDGYQYYYRPYIARLNTDGSLDRGFNPGTSPGGDYETSPVYSVVVQPDGNVLIGGGFTSINGVPRRGVARVLGGPSNRPPVADASATQLRYVSPNGTNATVVLNGSRSSDPDGDPLHYAWYEAGEITPLATDKIAATVLPVGTHEIYLAVNDSTDTNTNSITIEVITILQTAERLTLRVNSEVARPQSLLATLGAATASIGRNNSIAAINQLQALQNQVRSQVAAYDPVLAEALVSHAQSIIEALRGH